MPVREVLSAQDHAPGFRPGYWRDRPRVQFVNELHGIRFHILILLRGEHGYYTNGLEQDFTLGGMATVFGTLQLDGHR